MLHQTLRAPPNTASAGAPRACAQVLQLCRPIARSSPSRRELAWLVPARPRAELRVLPFTGGRFGAARRLEPPPEDPRRSHADAVVHWTVQACDRIQRSQRLRRPFWRCPAAFIERAHPCLAPLKHPWLGRRMPTIMPRTFANLWLVYIRGNDDRIEEEGRRWLSSLSCWPANAWLMAAGLAHVPRQSSTLRV